MGSKKLVTITLQVRVSEDLAEDAGQKLQEVINFLKSQSDEALPYELYQIPVPSVDFPEAAIMAAEREFVELGYDAPVEPSDKGFDPWQD